MGQVASVIGLSMGGGLLAAIMAPSGAAVDAVRDDQWCQWTTVGCQNGCCNDNNCSGTGQYYCAIGRGGGTCWCVQS